MKITKLEVEAVALNDWFETRSRDLTGLMLEYELNPARIRALELPHRLEGAAP